MQKFLVLYMAPAAGLEAWSKVDAEVREVQEAEMKAQWDAWMKAHGALFTGATAGAGATKRVTAEGITDTKNDVMLSAVIEAATHEDAARVFADHPHLGIPDAWIDVMPMNFLSETEA